MLPKATLCVGSTAGLPGRAQHNLYPSHFIPVAPWGPQGQLRSFQLTALSEDGPHPHRPSLIYITAFTPDLNSAEVSSALEETHSWPLLESQTPQ